MVSFVPPSSLNTAILLHATRNKQVVCCVLVGRSGRRATGPLSNTSSQGRNERLSYPQPLSASLTPARHNSISQPLRRRNKAEAHAAAGVVAALHLARQSRKQPSVRPRLTPQAQNCGGGPKKPGPSRDRPRGAMLALEAGAGRSRNCAIGPWATARKGKTAV
jgi:hypothetical protein